VVNLVPLVFSSGWASGVNAYLVVLVLGLADRWGDFEQIPDQLARNDVLVAAAVLFVGEFVVDKVPYLDSTWDAISTVIRPTVAAVIALLVSGDATSLEQAAYAVLGGGTALASHSVKAGSRLAINASPEPFSNWTASLAEDGLVVAVVLLVINHPWIALTITAVLLVAGLSLLFWLMGRIRHGWRRWKGRTVRSTA
jgi:hypothetical protein